MGFTPNEKIPDGRILRLPSPKGEEGEAKIIDATAEEYAPDLEREFGKILSYVLAGGAVASMLARVDSLPSGGLVPVLQGLLTRSGVASVTATSSILLEAGVIVPVTLAENIVAQWAGRYTYPLVRRIDTTSRSVLQRHISQWATENSTIEVLIKRLQPWFGISRGTAIAVTEATRAYSEGSFTVWEASGFERRPAEANRPPAHPRCRCFPAIAEGETGDPYWYYVWYTVRDRWVCPICEPKHGNVIGLAGRPN